MQHQCVYIYIYSVRCLLAFVYTNLLKPDSEPTAKKAPAIVLVNLYAHVFGQPIGQNPNIY